MVSKAKKKQALPEGWREVKLGDICKNITTGKLDVNAANPDGKYRFYTCAKNYYWIDIYAFDDEALLVSGNGAHVGYIHYYKGKFNAYQRTYVLTDFSADIKYLRYFMEKNLKNRIKAEVNAGNMPYIRLDTLTSMPIKIPVKFAEQKVIASLLEKWDTAIEKTEALIAAKEKQFRWLLKKLINDQKNNPEWRKVSLGDVLSYEQPTKYIVSSTKYVDKGLVPVLTANKSFILGYTLEKDGIFDEHPVIIFDDFTTASRYVDFPFKVKSSAMKILRSASNSENLKFVYHSMQFIDFPLGGHQRYWISEYQNLEIRLPPLAEQNRIVAILDVAQKEIHIAKKIAEQYRIQKRGLMQKLLTGEWRVNIGNHQTSENIQK